MVQLPLYDLEGKDLGQAVGPDEVFARKPNEALVHSCLTWFLAAQRQGNHSSKTRGEVRGGGKKPWKQKGTGRARAGSIRSPLWKKGGVIFGPKPRSYNYSFPKKMRQGALKSVLSFKAQNGLVKVVEQFNLPAAKTKLALKALKMLGLEGKILVLVGEKSEIFRRAARNIKAVKVITMQDLNIFDLLNKNTVVIEKPVLAQLAEVLA